MRNLICCAVFFVIQTLQLTFASTLSNEEKLAARVDQIFEHFNASTPGAAVAVVKDGKLLLAKGYGMANLEYDIPITEHTVFHVASVSKQFTAFSVYLLASQGKLKLTDNVREYIPELPNFGTPITINHLINHTSGLKDQWALLTLAGWRMDDVITQQQILKLIFQQTTLNFEPGSQFLYSNSGYTLLAEIVTRVSGKSFSEFTHDNIFQPLAMTNTQFYDDHEKVVKNRAYSYTEHNGSYNKQILSYANVGATGLFTTVADLSKWALNFDKHIVGDTELFNTFNQAAKLNNGEPAILAVIDGETIYHAKGQFFRRYRGLELYNHTGGDAGFRTYLARFPEKNISFIVLSNVKSFQPLQTGLDVAELYLSDALTPRQPDMSQTTNAATEPSDNKAVIDNLLQFSGDYISTELETKYSVSVRDDGLVMSHFRLNDTMLSVTGKDRFTGNIWFPVQVQFVRDKQNTVRGFTVSNFGAKNVIFRRQEAE